MTESSTIWKSMWLIFSGLGSSCKIEMNCLLPTNVHFINYDYGAQLNVLVLFFQNTVMTNVVLIMFHIYILFVYDVWRESVGRGGCNARFCDDWRFFIPLKMNQRYFLLNFFDIFCNCRRPILTITERFIFQIPKVLKKSLDNNDGPVLREKVIGFCINVMPLLLQYE